MDTASNQFEILKLYSPLYIRERTYDQAELIVVPKAFAQMYALEVEDALERDMDYDTPRGLMQYYGDQDSVNEKVHSCKPYVEYINGELHGIAILECKALLTQEELAKIKDFVTGQWSDGFGEGFEQHPIHTPDGDLYISFWNSNSFYLKTENEMHAMGDRQHMLTISKER